MSRRGEFGLIRGCCLGLIVLTALGVAAGYGAVRVLSRPDLGAPPSGVRHGGSIETIAAALAAEAASGLTSAPHTMVILSERDLTVLARARNPRPDRFVQPEARVREGLVVISAAGSLGPLTVTTVARLEVALGHGSRLISRVASVEAGTLTVPEWARTAIDPRGADTLSLDPVIDANPNLATLRANLDCLGVAMGGVRIGIHRPGETPSPEACV